MELVKKSNRIHAFDHTLAKFVGIEKAILLQNFDLWCEENARKKAKDSFHEGCWWTYESLNSLCKKYYYMRRSSISRWVNELVDTGWLVIKKKEGDVNYYTMGRNYKLWDRGEEWRTPEEIASQNEIDEKRRPKSRQRLSQNGTVSNSSIPRWDDNYPKMGHNDIEGNIEEGNVENNYIENNGEKSPFFIQTIEVENGLKIESFEEIEITPLEENPIEQKTLPGRGAKKKASEYTNRDVARHLDGRHQVFFAEVLDNKSWPDFLEYRTTRDRRTPYRDPKSHAIGIRQLFAACGGNSELAQAVVDQSRGAGWQGLFELKNSKKNEQSNISTTNYATNQREVLTHVWEQGQILAASRESRWGPLSDPTT